jgi:hypothetical protein
LLRSTFTAEILAMTRRYDVRKPRQYACAGHPDCGIGSPERPTSLVEGDRYDTSVAATIVEAKWFHHLPIYRQQDLFAGSGWAPGRSTLLNIVSQVEFVITPLRERESTIVLDAIQKWLASEPLGAVLPKSDLAEALRYLRNHSRNDSGSVSGRTPPAEAHRGRARSATEFNQRLNRSAVATGVERVGNRLVVLASQPGIDPAVAAPRHRWRTKLASVITLSSA